MGRASFFVIVLTVAVTAGCGLGSSNNGLPEGDILYGPSAIPATVECEDSDAFDDYEEFEAVESCEVVFKDGTGRETICQASQGADKPGRIWPGTCEAAAAAYRG